MTTAGKRGGLELRIDDAVEDDVEVAANPSGPNLERERRYALVVFAAVIVFAGLISMWFGRHRWFRGDEWVFLTSRDAGDIDGLLRGHNGHWSTLPVIEWRLLYNIFGLDSYRPYQVVVVAMHLVAAVLLRVTMRRAGVNPWIATTAAGAFALLGAGYKDIIWAFQVGFVGALVFGLLHLILADHDGPPGRRDVLGLAAGLAGLMCAGVAVALVAAVGVATLLRRGWRAALLHTVPLVAIYVVWAAKYSDVLDRDRPELTEVLDWVRIGWWAGIVALAQFEIAALLVTLALLGGLVYGAAVGKVRREWRIRAAAPIGLLVGSLVFEVSAANGVISTSLLEAGLGNSYARATATSSTSSRRWCCPSWPSSATPSCADGAKPCPSSSRSSSSVSRATSPISGPYGGRSTSITPSRGASSSRRHTSLSRTPSTPPWNPSATAAGR